MTYGIVNADQIGTSVANTSLGAGDASLLKNRLINGAMTVSQYNGASSVTPASTAYTVDRWQLNISQASKLSAQQLSSSPPVGFSNYLALTSQSAYSVTSTDYFFLAQYVEGFNWYDLNWGTANAKTVTLSFWVQSSLTGTFGGVLQNYAATRSYPFTYTISSANTWTQISVTIAGDTSGTWVGATNGGALQVIFGLGAGSTRTNTAGSWYGSASYGATGEVSVVGTNGATFYITGVQLEVGSIATGFEYRQYQQELALCQRYYQKVGGGVVDIIYSAYGVVGNNAPVSLTFPVQMRATPTSTVVGTWVASNCPQPTIVGNSSIGLSINSTASANGQVTWYTSSSSTYVTNSAEL